MSSSTDPIEWFRYPFVATDALAKAWLTTETLLGLAPNTLDAYARGLDDFLGFCQKASISPATGNLATDGLQIRAVTMTDAPLKPVEW